MYAMNFNVAQQCIEILRQGQQIAFQPLPSQMFPKPGKGTLMAMPGNQEAYDVIYDLVADANDGCGMEG